MGLYAAGPRWRAQGSCSEQPSFPGPWDTSARPISPRGEAVPAAGCGRADWWPGKFCQEEACRPPGARRAGLQKGREASWTCIRPIAATEIGSFENCPCHGSARWILRRFKPDTLQKKKKKLTAAQVLLIWEGLNWTCCCSVSIAPGRSFSFSRKKEVHIWKRKAAATLSWEETRALLHSASRSSSWVSLPAAYVSKLWKGLAHKTTGLFCYSNEAAFGTGFSS